MKTASFLRSRARGRASTTQVLMAAALCVAACGDESPTPDDSLDDMDNDAGSGDLAGADGSGAANPLGDLLNGALGILSGLGGATGTGNTGAGQSGLCSFAPQLCADRDAGMLNDGGKNADAGHDGGAADAGTHDAGAHDAGVDASTQDAATHSNSAITHTTAQTQHS